MRYGKYFGLVLLVILLDQVSKLAVHYNMEMGGAGQIRVIGEWFRLYYVLNPGIAFGINFDAQYSKLLLTLFRILASIGIGYYLVRKIGQEQHPGFLVALSLILAGAVGNVIDSVFYGALLEGNVIEGAFTPWFHGQVIDMLYFPLIEGYLPDWLPIWGGEYFLFFSAIFNIADSAIFLGVVSILIFQHKFMPEGEAEEAAKRANEDPGNSGSVEEADKENKEG